MGGHDQQDSVSGPGEQAILSPIAQEGVAILERAAEDGDPGHYLAVQDMLLRDTDKHGPEDGPEVDLVSQVPLPLDEMDESTLDVTHGDG